MSSGGNSPIELSEESILRLGDMLTPLKN